MYAFLGVFAMLGVLTFLVLSIIAKVKKNGKVKKWGIWTGACFAVFVLALILTPGLTPEQIAQAKTADELKVKQAAEIETKTAADKVIADAKAKIDAEENDKQITADRVAADAKSKVDAEAKEKQAAIDKVAADAKATENKKIADAKEVEDKKVADAQAAAAAEAAKPKHIAYKELARNPDTYMATNVIFTGRVIQVQEDGKYVGLRVNVTKNSYGYEDTMFVQYDKSLVTGRVLDDDIITFSGMSMGLLTYKTVLGAEMSIPQVLATTVTIK